MIEIQVIAFIEEEGKGSRELIKGNRRTGTEKRNEKGKKQEVRIIKENRDSIVAPFITVFPQLFAILRFGIFVEVSL
jgi:hypothetical protein